VSDPDDHIRATNLRGQPTGVSAHGHERRGEQRCWNRR
jgi:hypothetical protein